MNEQPHTPNSNETLAALLWLTGLEQFSTNRRHLMLASVRASETYSRLQAFRLEFPEEAS